MTDRSVELAAAKTILDRHIADYDLPVPTPKGIILTGGAVRRAILGEQADSGQFPDYDYMVDHDKVGDFASGLRLTATSATADTYSTAVGAKVQELTKRRLHLPYLAAKYRCDSFDFTMCQVWYDGESVQALNDDVIEDILAKRLVHIPTCDNINWKRLASRFVRFMSEGWTSPQETTDWVHKKEPMPYTGPRGSGG